MAPFYYDITRETTSNSTTQTLTCHLRSVPAAAVPDEGTKQGWLDALRAAGCSRATIG